MVVVGTSKVDCSVCCVICHVCAVASADCWLLLSLVLFNRCSV